MKVSLVVDDRRIDKGGAEGSHGRHAGEPEDDGEDINGEECPDIVDGVEEEGRDDDVAEDDERGNGLWTS